MKEQPISLMVSSPKGAFDGMPNLKRVKATLAKEIGLKAFSGCEKLEIIDFPNVEKTGVQASHS